MDQKTTPEEAPKIAVKKKGTNTSNFLSCQDIVRIIIEDAIEKGKIVLKIEDILK